jgi:putative ABC transport system permease protein
MIRFLFKGILRDKNRSVLPIIVVTLGVILTVFLSTWIKGIFTDMIDINANFSTGHVKVATAAYFESTNAANDLALLDVDELVTTMYGSMMFYNFVVSGTVRFGNQLLDRGAIIVDITDAQIALDMENAAGEIFGFLQEGYDTEIAEEVKVAFNAKYYNEKDEFSPKMEQLNDQNGLSEYLVLIDSMSGIMSFIFIFAMSIVLWNTGLLGGLRRYTEFGIRLALGEEKKHIYRSLIYEAILIGLIGSIIGSAIGLGYWVQNHGLQLGASIQGGSMMMPTVFRTMVTPEAFYIGFIPGLLAMVIGNALSGVAIYKRQTAQLFKELEV